MEQLHHCILTGYQFDESVKFDETTGPFISYEFYPVGKVKIAFSRLIELKNSKQFHNPILAGICRNAFENKQEPPMLSRDFLDNGLKNLNYPKTFKEKVRHMLKFWYDREGNNFKSFRFNAFGDYTLSYAENPDEFKKIITYLDDKSFIKIGHEMALARGQKQYENVQMTDYGIEEIEKELPKIPMIGLVSQEITTGDIEIDEKINHAKDLFFQELQTVDRMRSACETLSYVLEPLRKDLEEFFKGKDVNDFFQIVNSFDIRHNKEHTKDIVHSEQLEWVFYTLLNTINTFTKLKQRLG